MVLNIINDNFGLVKSWQKSLRPIGARVLFIPFWSHSKSHTKAQLERPKRLAQLNNQLCGEKHTKFLRTWNGVYVSVRLSFILPRTNWLRDHTSWAISGIGVKIKSVLKNFWSSVLKFTTPRYTLLFLNSETYIVHVNNCE